MVFCDMTEDIKTGTEKRKLHTYNCPICKQTFTDFDRMKKHLIEHTFESEETVDFTTYTCPCGCKFDSREEAEHHIALNAKLCGYYYRKGNSEETLLYIDHVEKAFIDNVPWNGYELSLKSDSIEVRGGKNRHISEYIERSRRNAKIEWRVDSGFEKITEEMFRELFSDMSEKALGQIMDFEYKGGSA